VEALSNANNSTTAMDTPSLEAFVRSIPTQTSSTLGGVNNPLYVAPPPPINAVERELKYQ
jgi:hypothetical protein